MFNDGDEAEAATSDEMCVVELSYSEWSNAMNREV